MLILTVLSSCQKLQDEEVKSDGKDVAAGEAQPVSPVAELLAAMSMYHFDQPVKAPDFELNSVNGSRVSLSQFRGKVVMLSFWATW